MSGTISYQIPQAGQPNSTEDAKVATALTALLAAINGGLDSTNIAAVLAQAASVNQAGQTVKGAVSIAGSESRTNVAYGTLATPDQVTGIVLPTNGLISVWYQAMWQESITGNARAAIFIGANQLITPGGFASGSQEAEITGAVSAATSRPLQSTASGLYATTVSTAAPVTTGQAIGWERDTQTQVQGGGPCYIFAAAGTYTISVQFKASSGSVTASSRKLWVQAISFS